MEERHGEAYELGEQLTVVGRKLRRGDAAPEFALDHFDGSAMRTVRLADSAGTVRLLNVVNSLDTAVCLGETARWERLRADLPTDVRLYNHSMDLPYAQHRRRVSDGVHQQSRYAHKSEQCGHDYGVLIKEWRLLQRAVFVIDRDGRIAHAEYGPDQMAEPYYDAANAAASEAAR